MNIEITVKHVDNPRTDGMSPWTETLNVEKTRCLSDAAEGLTPDEYGQIVIDYFNSTLRPHEIARELVSAKEIS